MRSRWFLLPVIVISLMLLTLAPASAEEASPTPVRIGVYDNPPLIDLSGAEPSGFIPDLVAEIADANGWDVTYVVDTWPNQLDRLERGDIDLLAPVAWTAEREQHYRFNSSTVLSNWGVIVQRTSDSDVIDSFEELDGLRIGVLEMDVFLQGADGLYAHIDAANADVEIVTYESYSQVFDSLEREDVDAVLANRLVAAEYATPDRFVASPLVVSPISIRFAAPRDGAASRTLLGQIDTTLSRLQLDPESVYYESMREHLSALVASDGGVPAWTLWAAAVSALVLVGLVATITVLRRVIASRTAELEIALARLRSLFEALPDAVFVLDFEGRVLDFKPAATWSPAIPTEVFLGEKLADLPMPPYVIDALTDTVRLVQEDRVSRSTSYWLTTPYPDGEPRHYEARIAVAGESELMMVVRDTTEEVAAEHAERERAAELENAVAMRTRELVETNLELTAASQAKSVFLANMSHELRTPLNSVIGFSGTLLSGLAGELNEEQRRQLEMVNRSGHHLLSLVNDVLDLSRIESGRAEPRPQRVDVSTVVAEATGPLEGRARAKGIGIAVEGASGEFVTDRRMLLQILINLVNNAVKFTTEGGVTVRSFFEEDDLVIEVVDTGPGMAPDEIPRAFEDFYQIGRPGTAKTGGFGLGLPISMRLAELIDATLDVDSVSGVGSTFRLRVHPMTEEPESA